MENEVDLALKFICLHWVRERVERNLGSGGDESDRRDDSDDEAARDLHFLDYGAGSGVLGIAAAAVVRAFDFGPGE